VFAERLASARPAFSLPRLESYVTQDLELIAAVRPDVVVGDFRLSLAASAREAGAPYISISNAYWSPDQPLRAIRPTVGRFRGWPSLLADTAFHVLGPPVLRWHATPVHQLLIRHGFTGTDRDLRRAFTEADLILFADLPSLFPEVAPTTRQRFIGPPPWEPPVALPPWWDSVPDDVLLAYLTLGSSGDAVALVQMADWLVQMGFTVMVATAGRASLDGDGRRLFVADYLPGRACAQRAGIVICNGGSPTANQALAAGRPVLGVCSNLDQFLNMRAVEGRGAGLTLRADHLRRAAFERAVVRLQGPSFRAAAEALEAEAAALDPAAGLAQSIEDILS